VSQSAVTRFHIHRIYARALTSVRVHSWHHLTDFNTRSWRRQQHRHHQAPAAALLRMRNWWLLVYLVLRIDAFAGNATTSNVAGCWFARAALTSGVDRLHAHMSHALCSRSKTNQCTIAQRRGEHICIYITCKCMERLPEATSINSCHISASGSDLCMLSQRIKPYFCRIAAKILGTPSKQEGRKKEGSKMQECGNWSIVITHTILCWNLWHTPVFLMWKIRH